MEYFSVQSEIIYIYIYVTASSVGFTAAAAAAGWMINMFQEIRPVVSLNLEP